MNALVRIFASEPVEALDLSEFDALTDLDFNAPLETPRERAIRQAEEELAKAETVIAGCDNLLAQTQQTKADHRCIAEACRAQIAILKQREALPLPAPRKAKRA